MSILILTISPAVLPLSHGIAPFAHTKAKKQLAHHSHSINTTRLNRRLIMRGTLSSSRGMFVAKLVIFTDTFNVSNKRLFFYQKLRHSQGKWIPKCCLNPFQESDLRLLGPRVRQQVHPRSINTQDNVPLALYCAVSLAIHWYH